MEHEPLSGQNDGNLAHEMSHEELVQAAMRDHLERLRTEHFGRETLQSLRWKREREVWEIQRHQAALAELDTKIMAMEDVPDEPDVPTL